MAVTLKVVGNQIIFTNNEGDWTIWKEWTADYNQGTHVGPGYIGRFKSRKGALIVDDFSETNALNDSRNGGLGCFGMHLARKNDQYDQHPEAKYNYTWDLTGRMEASINGFGVLRTVVSEPFINNNMGFVKVVVYFSDGESYPNALFKVTYEHEVSDSKVVTMAEFESLHYGEGSTLYVKEPKFVAHSIGPVGGPSFRFLDTFDKDGKRIPNDSMDLWQLPHPSIKTKQLRSPNRCRVRFAAPNNLFFNIVAEGSPGGYARDVWINGPGLDKWAVDANKVPAFSNDGGAYCLQGPQRTLTRQWEVTRYPVGKAGTPPDPKKPQVGAMFHAWEGGTGYPDCLCAYRLFPVNGTKYRAWFCYSLDTGWIV